MPIRTRNHIETVASCEKRSSGFGAWTPYSSVKVSQETVYSQNNPFSGGHFQGGGPFQVIRNAYEYNTIDVNQGLCRGTVGLGPISTGSYVSLPGYTQPNDSSLTVSGTSAFSKTLPTNPTFDLASAMGELRFSGMPSPPMLKSWKEGTFKAKQAGSEYLNYDFGWLPLVSDMRDFAHAVNNADSIFRKYRKSANRVIQSSYEFPKLEASKFTNVTYVMDPNNAGSARGGVFEYATQRRWFEAEYIYFLPVGNSQGDKIARFGSYARKLLGVGINPEAIWNLTPWSWATDWFLNTGDIIGNIGNFTADGLVARHAYIMCHSRLERQYYGLATGSNKSTSYTTVAETKRRLPATPYGFGVNYSGLSPRRIATIAALGLSRW